MLVAWALLRRVRAHRAAVAPRAALATAAAPPLASLSNPTLLVVLEYVYASSSMEELVALRAPHRDKHLTHARCWAASGRLLMGGAFGDLPTGGMLIFAGATKDEVTAFAEADPYVRAGVVRRYSVRPWTVVVEGAPVAATLA